jgi:hypothetical protein
MASSSVYQRMIEHLRLPGNVEVNVFAGDQDSVFKHSTCRAKVSAREHFARTPDTRHAGGHPLNARKG